VRLSLTLRVVARSRRGRLESFCGWIESCYVLDHNWILTPLVHLMREA
jgi:hypothetical protein